MIRTPKTSQGNVVIIEDDEATRISIRQMLQLRHYTVDSFDSAIHFLHRTNTHDLDCIITDIKMPGMDGEQLIATLNQEHSKVPIIVITAHGDVALSVRCLKNGAYDFVEKPFEDDVLIASVQRAVEKNKLQLETQLLRKQIKNGSPTEDCWLGMVGKSKIMLQMFEQIRTVAKADYPVLITGETGTGKDLVAKAIHGLSPRSGKPYVVLNAGALPENIVESELFGHVRGAFTGADSKRDGKLISADQGTLFLDEIESIPVSIQVKLLRVLEDGSFFPLGSDSVRQVSIRLVVSTNEDLLQLVQDGKIRNDFYHRIHVLPINIPPLRDRKEDIPLLTAWFIREATQKNKMPLLKISESTLQNLLSYPWPGNIRELKHSIERMVITAGDDYVSNFPFDDRAEPDRLFTLPSSIGYLRTELEKAEQTLLIAALKQCRGEINATAAVLGINRRALYERMKKYGLEKESFYSR